ncbi:hypothetical protein MCOR13_011850 [Pyricularia oryzae]|nr:hypothetical protein MCOR13_011850 [Pyricularia oryzae]
MSTTDDIFAGNVSTTPGSLMSKLGIEDIIMPLISRVHGSPLIRTLILVNQSLGAYLPTALVTATSFAWVTYHLTRQFFSVVWHLTLEYITSKISVSSDDEIFEHVMVWLAAQPRTVRSRRLIAETAFQTVWEDGMRQVDLATISENCNKYLNFSQQKLTTPIRYTPSSGPHIFSFQGKYFSIDRQQRSVMDNSNTESEAVTIREKETFIISTFGLPPEPIKQFLAHARKHHHKDHGDKTLIMRPNSLPQRRFHDRAWREVAKRPVRPISTVVLDREQKTAVLSDMNEYLQPKTERWYSNRGIPLRRGYLFHGPPGTGKTSLSFALAGVFGLEIYVISLIEPQLSDEDLSTLFNGLPRRCIVLLEDIDTTGMSRAEGEVRTETKTDGPSEWKVADLARALKVGRGHGEDQKGISMSGLLNAIDGVAAHEGRILIMTTNKPETLDKALIRPGRVDLQVAFRNATQQQASELFQRLYSTEQSAKSSQCLSQLDATDKKYDLETSITDADELIEMAAEFGSKIVPDQMSPAEIQGFLLKRKTCPRKALRDVEAWVKTSLDHKASKKISG